MKGRDVSKATGEERTRGDAVDPLAVDREVETVVEEAALSEMDVAEIKVMTDVVVLLLAGQRRSLMILLRGLRLRLELQDSRRSRVVLCSYSLSSRLLYLP